MHTRTHARAHTQEGGRGEDSNLLQLSLHARQNHDDGNKCPQEQKEGEDQPCDGGAVGGGATTTQQARRRTAQT